MRMRCAVLAASAGLAIPAVAGIISPSEVVAYSLMPAPGTAGAFFNTSNSFSNYVLDGTGQVSFLASGLLAGDTGTNNTSGLWTGTPTTNVSKVARGGEQAPGLAPGVVFVNSSGASGLNFASTRASSGDSFIFGGTVSGPGITNSVNDQGVWLSGPSGVSKVVQRNDPAPGTAGALMSQAFRGFSAQTFAFNGTNVAFNSSLAGGDTVTANNAAVFTGSAGSLTQVSRKGDILDSGLTLSAYQFNVKINGNGQVLTDVTLGGTATAANNKASYIYTPGVGNVRVARSGDAAPGTAGAVFSGSQGMGFRSFSNAGLLFNSSLTGGDVVGTTNDTGYWITSPVGAQQLLVRKGDAAPGTDGVFSTLHSSIFSFNNNGVATFQGAASGGTITSANNMGLWQGTPGSLTLVAREGDLVPGTLGAVLGDWNGVNFSSNNAGQVVFEAPLLGGDVVGSTNNRALFGWNPGAGKVMITRLGDQFEVTPGNFKTITQFTVQPVDNGSGATQGLNDAGQIALYLTFSDSTNALLRTYVPAPGVAAMGVLGAMMGGRRRRSA